MSASSKRGFIARLDHDLQFFRTWLSHPRRIGAFVPTGTALARRMAAIVDPDDPLPVLEIGPGTGSITRAILQRGLEPARLTAIEFDPGFAERMSRDFPDIRLIQGSAFDLHQHLGDPSETAPLFQCAVSALPLLNHPVTERISYIVELLKYIRPDGAIIQFSYGHRAPVPRNGGSYELKFGGHVLRNVPPAKLWIYRQKGGKGSETG
ncbi:class I SAM-dependent methyltransferase [Limoniibacter endophyticus]|uniref:SAM-dependent methyltransferase n=1 Tax=Limoniibacter endophyticus TaxID=1565040 RepID=A0A8J3DQK6_9HYPH|nr:methyltransferase domain-containing protein [Limoniibacter endophyticus]GHC66975.1 SAM-dependent methyltransferase [Limoniibacter endophyticus]